MKFNAFAVSFVATFIAAAFLLSPWFLIGAGLFSLFASFSSENLT